MQRLLLLQVCYRDHADAFMTAPTAVGVLERRCGCWCRLRDDAVFEGVLKGQYCCIGGFVEGAILLYLRVC